MRAGDTKREGAGAGDELREPGIGLGEGTARESGIVAWRPRAGEGSRHGLDSSRIGIGRAAATASTHANLRPRLKMMDFAAQDERDCGVGKRGRQRHVPMQVPFGCAQDDRFLRDG